MGMSSPGLYVQDRLSASEGSRSAPDNEILHFRCAPVQPVLPAPVMQAQVAGGPGNDMHQNCTEKVLRVHAPDYSIRLDFTSLNNGLIGTLFDDGLCVVQDHLVLEGDPVAIHLKVTQHKA
jgi:hypothetical protein